MNMKKNFKRWLALMLAVVMVVTTCMTHTDGFLRATDGAETETAQTVDVPADPAVTNTTDGEGAVTPDAQGETNPQLSEPTQEVQEIVIPKQEPAAVGTEGETTETTETTVNDGTADENAAANEATANGGSADGTAPADGNATETVAPTEKTEGQEVEVVPSDKKENLYNVVFHKPAVNGGKLYVWEEGQKKEEASYKDGKFVKEVKEGTTLCFEIKTTENFSVEKVTDKSGQEIKPEKATKKSSVYKMVVEGEKEITILYKEETKNLEDKEIATFQKEETKPVQEMARVPRKDVKYELREATTGNDTLPTIRDGHGAEYGGGDAPNTRPESGYIVAEEGVPFRLNASNLFGLYEFDATMNIHPSGGIDVRETHWTFSYAETNNERAYIYAFLIKDGELYYTTDRNWDQTSAWKPYVLWGTTQVTFRYSVERPGYDISVVQYWGNGNTAGIPEVERLETTLNANIKIASEGSLQKKGYKFVGWTNNPDGNGQIYEPGDTYNVGNALLTQFYAKWEKEAENYSVTFDSQGGTFVESQTIESGKKATEPKPDPTKDGYKFIGWYLDNQKYNFNTAVTKNITLTAKWEKDFSKTKILKYTVEHVIEGKEEPEATQDYTETVWINAENKITIQEGSVDAKEYKGYKLESMSPSVKAGDKVPSGTEIVLTYTRDDEQTKTLKYTVKHVVAGEEKDTKEYTETVWVNEDNNLVVKEGSLAEKEYKGYRFDSMTPEVKEGSEVETGTTIILNYVKDESQTQKTSYTVKHVVAGEEKDTKEYTGTAWINDENPEIEIQAGSVDTKEYKGYKLESMSPSVKAGDKVPSGTEIVLTYVPDFSAVAATGVNKVYNGDESKIEVVGLLPTDTVRYLVNGEVIKNSFTDVTNKDVVVEVTRGSVKHIAPAVDVIITARPLTITAASAEKLYDGEALTNVNYEIAKATDDTGLVKDEAISAVTVTGSQTLVGNSANTPSNAQFSKGKATNYAIEYVLGTLTVTDGGDISVDPNKVITKTHEGKEYKLGETITFTIKATNIYATPKTMTIVEQTGVTITGESVFENVKPGETVETTATYVVSETDILNQSFTNNVSVKFSDVDSEFGNKDEVTKEEIEDKNGHLTLQKEVTSKPANKVAYVLGETITYSITATNDGNLTLTNVVVNDEMTGDTWTIESIAPGASETFTTSHVVTEDDLLNGEVLNTVTASGTSPDPEKPKVPVTPGEVPAPVEVAGPSLYVEKTASPVIGGTAYSLGDEVVYTIKVVNNGNLTINDISVIDKMTGDQWSIDQMKPGDAKTFTTKKYVVTEKDILEGKVVNKADVKGTATNKDEVHKSATVVIPTDAKFDHLTIEKKSTSDPGKDKTYELGDTITYEITVTNDGNLTIKDIVVTDTLGSSKGHVAWADEVAVDKDNNALIKEMKPGDVQKLTCTYVVTEADVIEGNVINSATAGGASTDPVDPVPEVKPGQEVDKTEKEDPTYSVVKELVKEEIGKKFKVGETAHFNITVKNTGNVSLKNIEVTEELEGATFVKGEGYNLNKNKTVATIEKLAVDGTIVLKAEYVVQQKDEDNGETVNTLDVEAESTGKEEPDPVDPPKEEIPTEKHDPKFESTKVLTNKGTGEDGKFKVGETAKFDITVKNTGNVTLTNVKVTENLKGAEVVAGEGYEVVDGIAMIDEIKVGKSIVVKAEYVITQKDVDNGGAKNSVTVTGNGPVDPEGKPVDPENPDPKPVKPGTDIETEKHDPKFEAEKVLTNEGTGENGNFKVGETAKFDIKVKNTGNVTLTNIKVTEQLEGAKVVSGEGYKVVDGVAVIDEIPVGETAVVKAEYVITQADVDNNGVTNKVKVEGNGPVDPEGKPDPENPDPKPVDPEEPIPTEKQDPKFESAKTLSNKGTAENGKFKVGDTAKFDITVKNTGNVTLKDITVKENLEGAKIVQGEGYKVNWNGTATIQELPVGATVVVKAEYVITQADVDNGGAYNSVTVEAEGPGGEKPEKPDPEPENPNPNPEPEKPGTEIPTEDKDPKMEVVKTVTSSPREDGEYRIGDRITYQITVTNSGNITLNNVVVTDTLNATGQVTWDRGIETNSKNEALINAIAPGETVTLGCSYVVVEADEGKDLVNTAVGDSDETTPTAPSTTNPTEVEEYYNLTINYVYTDGTTAAPSVRARYLEGETFGYTSPTINGYTPDYAFVRSDANGMPARDVVFTVVYTAIPAVPASPTTPSDGTPNGGNATTNNASVGGNVTANNEPVGAELRATEDDMEVVPVVEEKVPLAKRNLDDHECCILHFLIMLIALIIYAAYTRSMKKRQERIAELADELEMELLKRSQGEAKENVVE